MDISDSDFISNTDWDPSYLHGIFDEDFVEFDELWISDIMDSELVLEANKLEKYCPLQKILV